MTALTDKLSDVAQYQVDLIKTNAVALGIAELVGSTGPGNKPSVFFGDQILIPVTPTVCVDPQNRTRALEHTGMKTTIMFSLYVLIYHGKVQDDQLNIKEAIQKAEAVEALLHTDKQMGGNVIQGWVANMEMGSILRQRTLMKVSRLTWVGQSQKVI